VKARIAADERGAAANLHAQQVLPGRESSHRQVEDDIGRPRRGLEPIGGEFLLAVGRDDALDLIGELRTQSVLDGARGAPPVNRESLATLMAKISELFLAHPEIVELDLNPVIAAASGCAILDARVIIG